MANKPAAPSHLSLAYLEGLYADYLRDPVSAPPEWQHYFAGLTNGEPAEKQFLPRPSFPSYSVFNPPTGRRESVAPRGEPGLAGLQESVDALTRNFRIRGHIVAQVDPLRQPSIATRTRSGLFYGFTEEVLDRPFACATMEPDRLLPLREIIQRLRNTYCRSIGVQFMHIDDLAVRHWLQERMESTQNRLELTREEQLRILTRLTDAVIFEEFIQKKFVGAKSFSLEGCESLIPLLDLAIEKAGEQGVDEIVLGMAHRGRLNVLANIMGKSPREIFREFEDAEPELTGGRGDVKYHLGYSNDWITAGRAEGPLVALLQSQPPGIRQSGRAGPRPRQAGPRRRRRAQRGACACLIHGDAAFAGEGIVQETLNLSQLPGYTVGGTLHVIVNNQIGFTTPPQRRPLERLCHRRGQDAASRRFSTSTARTPKRSRRWCGWRMDFRANFQRDVVIDMYGYRRLRPQRRRRARLHPAGAVSSASQQRKTVREGYLEHLLELGEVTRAGSRRNRRASARELLEKELCRRPAAIRHAAAVQTLAASGTDYSRRPGSRRTTRHGRRKRAAGAACSRRKPDCRTISIRIRKSSDGLEARREMAARRTAAGLGGGRGAGLRQPGDRGHARAPERPG